jgi:hypothetical protein
MGVKGKDGHARVTERECLIKRARHKTVGKIEKIDGIESFESFDSLEKQFPLRATAPS